MKNLLLISFLFLGITISNAQTGINTLTPNAQLEIKSSNQAAPLPTDGLLIPKIDVFPAINPTALQDGMMVYLTTNVGANLKGFYSWDNFTTTWTPITTPVATNVWGLSGNAGINPILNFIGTTDNTDLVFRRDNLTSGRIKADNTSFGFLSLFIAQPASQFNTAFGVSALRFNTVGNKNTGIGHSVLFDNTDGNGNTAVGSESLRNNTTGSSNTAIGNIAMVNNTTGNSNIAIGANTLVPDGAANHQLNIGNQIFGTGLSGSLASPTGNIGIGTTTPNNTLEIKSTTANTSGLTFTNLTSNSPTSTGKPLGINASGTVVAIEDNSLNNWSKTGNAGTNPATNFIGTTDAQPLRFKVDNVWAGQIHNTNSNVSFGLNALSAATTGVFNIAMGSNALVFNSAGNFNIATGGSALQNNTTGSRNNASGFQALWLNTTGNDNIATGFRSLQLNTTGNDNVAYGHQALGQNSTGNNNVASGRMALFYNTSGSGNVATGIGALYSNTTATGNVGTGFQALLSNTTGELNTAIGFNSSDNITSGSNNTTIGANTRIAVATANNQLNIGNQIFGFGLTGSVAAPAGNIGIGTTTPNNTLEIKSTATHTSGLTFTNLTSTSPTLSGRAIGVNATGEVVTIADNSLNNWSKTGNTGTDASINFIGTTDDIDLVFKRNNITAGRISTSNLSFGHEALTANTTGLGNSAFGSFSLNQNTVGANNSAFGVNALNINTTGSGNTAIGVNSQRFNISGTNNTSLGQGSLRDVTTASDNVGIGFQALVINTIGTKNVGLGTVAGNTITTGNNNIAIGHNAQVPSGTADNQIRIGDANITYAGTQVAWTITSDKRWKNSIQPSTLGLKFIQMLKPVSYVRNKDASKKLEYGFIAQELESALIESGVTKSGIINKDDKEMLSVRYNDLLAPMVKAIQEQQKMIDELKTENNLLKVENTQNNKTIQAILSDIESMKNQLNTTLITSEK